MCWRCRVLSSKAPLQLMPQPAGKWSFVMFLTCLDNSRSAGAPGDKMRPGKTMLKGSL